MVAASDSSAERGATLVRRFMERDPAVLKDVLACTDGAALALLAERLVDDDSAYAHGVRVAYLEAGGDRPGHRPLFKRLLKRASGSDRNGERGAPDLALLPHALAAVDRLEQHRVVGRGAWSTRRRVVPGPAHDDDTFSLATRRYLRRRLVRAVRALASRADPAARAQAAALITTFLCAVTDDDTKDGSALLDRAALLAILCAHSPVLAHDAHRVRVVAGHSLDDLRAAPLLAEAFLDPSLWLAALPRAQSALVRRLMIGFLSEQATMALRLVPLQRLLPLLSAPALDVRVFAASLVDSAPAAGLDVKTWLALLHAAKDEDTAARLLARALPTLRTAALDDEALLVLARSPYAALATFFANQLAANAHTPLSLLVQACDADVVEARAVLCAVALARAQNDDDTFALRDLLDIRHPDVRARACQVLADNEDFRDDVGLWAALCESPWPDARAFLLQHLDERLAMLPKTATRFVWAQALIATTSGSRHKRTALRQVVDRVAAVPAEAPELLPLCALLLRSSRAAERHVAVGVLARAAFGSEALRGALSRHLPELRLLDLPDLPDLPSLPGLTRGVTS